MDTKKILLYGGGAIAVGAVGFFVWSFFQKVDVPLSENTKNPSNENATANAEEKSTNSGTNYFQSLLEDFKPLEIKPPVLSWQGIY